MDSEKVQHGTDNFETFRKYMFEMEKIKLLFDEETRELMKRMCMVLIALETDLDPKDSQLVDSRKEVAGFFDAELSTFEFLMDLVRLAHCLAQRNPAGDRRKAQERELVPRKLRS